MKNQSKTWWENVPWIKVAVFGVIVTGIAIAYVFFADALTLRSLAEKESQLREYQQRQPVLVYAIAFIAYVVMAGLSLPGAAGLTLLYGWYFGWLPGVIVVSFASTTGAMLAFLLSRYLFRDVVKNRFGKRLKRFNESLEREGPFYLFALRLIPAIPFFVINAAMGLTPIHPLTFWWVSQLGMLPGTALYVYAGSSVPSLETLAEDGIGAAFSTGQLIQIIIAFALLGIFPLAARWIMKRFWNKDALTESDHD